MAAWDVWAWIGYISLIIPAIQLALEQTKLPMLEPLKQISGGVWGYIPLALLTVAGLILVWRVIRPPSRRCLEILAPLDGYSVGFTHTVIGMIDPSDAPIQILVHAGDERWHPQGQPKIEGLAFSAQCQFGNADTRPGRMYQIVALSSAPPVSSPTYELPRRGRKSQIVRVVRTT
jgi:hypothetical protein